MLTSTRCAVSGSVLTVVHSTVTPLERSTTSPLDGDVISIAKRGAASDRRVAIWGRILTRFVGL